MPKAVCEAMFADIAAAEPIRVLSLRYFNPIGADPEMRTGLQLARPTHALGKMIQAHEEGVPFVVTGTDYPTRDGSGIRDYIHVWDLAAAHVAALDRFEALPGPTTAINLGTGRGTPVRELLDAFNHVAQSPVEALDAGRRPGDVAGAYTRIDRARHLLGWQPQYDITKGIRHLLQWAAIRDQILSLDAASPNHRIRSYRQLSAPAGPGTGTAAVRSPRTRPGHIPLNRAAPFGSGRKTTRNETGRSPLCTHRLKQPGHRGNKHARTFYVASPKSVAPIK